MPFSILFFNLLQLNTYVSDEDHLTSNLPTGRSELGASGQKAHIIVKFTARCIWLLNGDMVLV